AAARRPRFPAGGDPGAREAVSRWRHPADLRALAGPIRLTEPTAQRHLFHPGPRRIASMRAPRPASCPPAIRSGAPAGLLLLMAAAVAWAQGMTIPDLRDPAQYREPARTSSCRVCGEIRSIREIRIQPNRAAAQNPTNQMV